MSLCHQGTHLQIQASGKLIYLSRELGIYLSIETCPALTGLALWAGQVAGYCCPSQPSTGMGEISSWLLLPALSSPNKRWRAPPTSANIQLTRIIVGCLEMPLLLFCCSPGMVVIFGDARNFVSLAIRSCSSNDSEETQNE